MKKIILSIAIVAATVGVYSFTTKDGDVYTADVAKSKVEFVGSKTDGYHPGVFTLKSGEVTVLNGKLTGGKFVIDLTSLKITDEAGERLAGHLQGADFLDFSKSKEATYTINTVKYVGATKADVEGTLTLKGITAPVKFSTNIRSVDAKGLFAEASFSLDRTTFGMNYGVGKISSDVLVNVHLFATASK